jgi:predicted class III extradiol MEMO1 family dioxygenase
MSIITMIQNKDYEQLKSVVEDKIASIIGERVAAKKVEFVEKIRSEKK